MKMKAKDKAKWLEALRSGEYKQTDSALCVDGAYCCLGVLQTILDGKPEEDAKGDYLPQPTVNFLNRHGIEVETREIKSDIDATIAGQVFPYLDWNGTYARLMDMNDELDSDDDCDALVGCHLNPFPKIADFIEQNVEVYD